METNNTNKISSFLTEGVLIALASAFVYLITYAYEAGYCSHFDIPRTFISLNITTILVAAASVGTVIFSSMHLLGFSVPLLKAGVNPSEKQEPFRMLFLLNGMFLIAGIFLLKSYDFSWQGFWIFLATVFFFNLVQFGPGLVAHRKKESLGERFKAINQDRDVFDIWEFLIEKLGRDKLIFIFWLAMSFMVAYFIGNGEANRQKEFLTLKAPESYVLLRNYGDLIIAAPIDRNKRLVEKEFLMLRASSIDSLELVLERIGPLEAAQYSTSEVSK